jgi:hypothetical protein
MMGITGLRMIFRDVKKVAEVPMSVVDVAFPHKTTVTSQQLIGHDGRPVYRKDVTL